MIVTNRCWQRNAQTSRTVCVKPKSPGGVFSNQIIEMDKRHGIWTSFGSLQQVQQSSKRNPQMLRDSISLNFTM